MIRHIKERIKYLKMNEKIDRKAGEISRAEMSRRDMKKLYPLLDMQEEDIIEILTEAYVGRC